MPKVLGNRWFRLLCAAGMLSTAAIFVAAFAARHEDRRICRQAQAWVRDHPDALPTTLAGLRMYPAAYRPAILGALGPDVRDGFWKEHLSEVGMEDLSLQQREIVEQLHTFGPQSNRSADREARLEALQEKATAIFSPEDYRRIFNDFGPAQGRPRTLASAGVTLSVAAQGLLDPTANAGVECECRRHVDCGDPQVLVCIGGHPCDPDPVCGGLPCTGICEPTR